MVVQFGEDSPSSGSNDSPNPLRSRSMSVMRSASMRRIQTAHRESKQFCRKPRNLVATGIFLIVLSRGVFNWMSERRRIQELMAPFDRGHDQLLNTSEMVTLLSANGLDFSKEQVRQIFGKVDDEDDGYDMEELGQIVHIISDLPAVSQRLRRADAGFSVYIDAVLCVAIGLGLAFLVSNSDKVEKKWAASSFRSAVHYRRMQSKCSKLGDDMAKISDERARLEKEIKGLETTSGNIGTHEEQLQVLNQQLTEVTGKQSATEKQLEEEVRKWQKEAETSLREASLTKNKMDRMMTCVKGMHAFTGLGTGSFAGHGAQQGFCNERSVGFSLDTISFGTIVDGKLHMYETSYSRKLGDGRDCAYKCTDLSTGSELALKMYKITRADQRRAIHHDLFAYQSNLGKHPRVVSYERVIESANTIFVLMELIAGMDLFDVVCGQRLSEDIACSLFKELAEGLQHLHGNGVIHCDVKPENAMVIGDIHSGNAHLKLIDFGCSCFTKYEEEVQGCIVFDSYMPPEHAEKPGLAPSFATDMWRVGCTLYVMLLQRPPFLDNAQTRQGLETRQAAGFFKGKEWDILSTDVKDLLTKLIIADPEQRLTVDQVLEHKWVKRGPDEK